jgi:G3E family GTPase
MADISQSLPQFTVVNLLTGFLGSGKTTLLKRMLEDPALNDTAVLINEFGEVGLDHQLVERIEEDMVLLQSGCICCTVRGELADALRDLHSRRERGLIPSFSRVVIESTGLADPFPILSTIKADPVLRHHFRPGNVITTVDAVNGAAQLDTYIESNRQAAIADWLIITKTDIADVEQATVLADRLRRINPDAEILDALGERFSVADLLDTDAAPRGARVQSTTGFYCEDSRELVTSDGTTHSARFISFAITVDDPIDWTGFGIWLTMLLNRHGERVLRVKGILNISGEPRPVAIHGVQHLVHTPVHMEAWASEDRRSHIVFIVDGLDATLLKRSFEAFAIAKVSADTPAYPQYSQN